jgi:hypothetical protein
MWFYRRALKISFEDHITNEEVLTRMGTEPNLLKKKHQKETGSIFRTCNEEGKIRTSDNNGKDRRSEEQRKAEREDLGWHKRMVVIRSA